MTSDQQNASIGSTEGFPAGLHPQTARLVRDFALALAAKLLRAEKEYGYNIGWLTEEWESECRRDLLKHIAKGDPLDVAAFAAFMWRRGWSTTVPQAADIEAKTSGRWMFVPEGTREIALELAPSLDKLIDAVLAHSEGKSDVMYHSSLRAFLWDNKVGLLRVLQAHASPPEVPFVDTTKLNAGQLVQRIMRVLDHNDSGAFGITKLAEAIAAGILDLPSDYWHKPELSPPEVREVTADEDRMVQIAKLIDDLTEIKHKFGNTCVYIRRHGLSWGAVALNYQDDDAKHGVFDMQAQHDRDMLARFEQIERLQTDRNKWRDRAIAAEARLLAPSDQDVTGEQTK